jgi:hypothetical protein
MNLSAYTPQPPGFYDLKRESTDLDNMVEHAGTLGNKVSTGYSNRFPFEWPFFGGFKSN